MADEKVVQATLRFGLDKSSAGQVAQGEKAVADGLKKIEQNAQAAKQRLNEIRESAEKLRMVGTAIAGVGAAGLAVVGMAVNAYVTKIGEAGVVSRQWLQANKSIEESQMRIGRVAAQTLLPYLQDAAKLAGQVADFVEQNPDAIKAALAIAGTAAVGGSALTAITTAVSTGTALIQVLSTAGIIGTGATAAGGAATGLTAVGTAAANIVAPLGLAAVALVGIGLAAKNFLEGYNQDKQWAVGTTIASSESFSDYQAKLDALRQKAYPKESNDIFGRTIIPSPETLMARDTLAAFPVINDEQSFKMYQEYFLKNTPNLVIPGPFGSRSGTSGSNGGSTGAPLQDALGTTFRSAEQAAALAKQLAALNDLYAASDDALQKRVDAERKGAADLLALDAEYNADKLQREKDFQDAETQAAVDYESNRLRAIRDFQTSEARATEDYYAARLENAQRYDAQAQRAEADHQKSIRRLMEDSGDRIKDLAGQRDAYGIMKEMENAEKDRRRQEEDYKDETERTNKAYAEDLDAQEKQYQKERTRRNADFQLRLSDEKQQFDIAAGRRKTAFDNANAAELSAYTYHRQALQMQTNSILADITRVFNALQTQINILAGPGAVVPGTPEPPKPPPGSAYADGGYMPQGLHRVGERGTEFALTAGTTRALERRAGGPLSQERVLRLGQGVNVAQSFTFNGMPQGAEAQTLVATIRRETALVMTQVFQGMGA